MNARPFRAWLSSVALTLAAAAATTAQDPAPPVVSVARPLVRKVTDYEQFTGRTEAVENVEIRARVTGYIDKVLFKDGAEVKKGDVLFVIDPRPYQAELNKAEAARALAEAHHRRVEIDYKRAVSMLPRRAIGQEEYDRIAGERTVAEAALGPARAFCDAARLDLLFTQVQAPIDGRIGRRLVDAGGLVRADRTPMATLVSTDPVYVYVDIDERTALHLLRDAGEGRRRGVLGLPVSMGLADEKGFPHRGKIDFIDNRVDPAKGTLSMRAVFPNPDHLLLPGLFARIRLSVGEPHDALLVPQTAVVMDRGHAFVFVVNDRNVAQRRPVELGSHQDGLRVVKDGLGADDFVVVDDLGGLRPGTTVQPRQVKIP
jgi:RND family efflux transporter MFP subunit